MKRRTWAGLLALVLVVGLGVIAVRQPVPYVTFAPGLTVNVLGKTDQERIIEVEGRESYRDKGALRLTTVVPSGPDRKVHIPELVTAWIDPDRTVYPYRAIYPEAATRESVNRCLNAYAERGILDFDRETITLRDPAVLRARVY